MSVTAHRLGICMGLAWLAACGLGSAEEFTLTTYYPAPFGVYDTLVAEKLVDYNEGSYNVPPLAGTDWFLDPSPRPYTDGTSISGALRGKVGIGVKNPQATFEVRGPGSSGNFFGGWPALAAFSAPSWLTWNLIIRDLQAPDQFTGFYVHQGAPFSTILGSATVYPIMSWRPDNGNVGIGVDAAADKLHIMNWTENSNVGVIVANPQRQYRLGVRGDSNNAFAIQDDSAGAMRLTIGVDGKVGMGNVPWPTAEFFFRSTDPAIGDIGFGGGSLLASGSGQWTSDFWFTGGTDGQFWLTNQGPPTGKTVLGHTAIVGGGQVWAPDLTILNANGNVGIGNATPSRPLSFANGTGEKISLYAQSGAARDYYGFGIEGSTLAYQVPSGQVHRFYQGSSERMRIDSAGVTLQADAIIAPGSGLTLNNTERTRWPVVSDFRHPSSALTVNPDGGNHSVRISCPTGLTVIGCTGWMSGTCSTVACDYKGSHMEWGDRPTWCEAYGNAGTTGDTSKQLWTEAICANVND